MFGSNFRDWFARLRGDARDAQILFLTIFLGLGGLARDWSLRPSFLLAVVGSCQLAQWAAQWAAAQWCSRRLQPESSAANNRAGREMGNPPAARGSWKSALITSLGLCLLLRGNSLLTPLLAGVLAIASKFCLRWRGKHIFNPANFGLMGALLLANDAWVSPGQWGGTWWLLAIFIGAGGVVLGWVGRWETSIAFLATYAVLELLRDVGLGWSPDVWTHQLTSGSLLVFALFMLTDPRSIPDRRVARLLWAGAIAGLTCLLQHVFFVAAAPFWALWLLAPLTPLLDWWLPSARFEWRSLVPTAAAEPGNLTGSV